MIVLTPIELAARWGITEMEVVQKIYNTLNHKNGEDKLPDAFMVRQYPDCYRIIIPDGYKFNPIKKLAIPSRK